MADEQDKVNFLWKGKINLERFERFLFKAEFNFSVDLKSGAKFAPFHYYGYNIKDSPLKKIGFLNDIFSPDWLTMVLSSGDLDNKEKDVNMSVPVRDSDNFNGIVKLHIDCFFERVKMLHNRGKTCLAR